MKDLLVACVVAGVAIGVSGLAFAGEAKSPKLLSDAQMEKVVAGAVYTNAFGLVSSGIGQVTCVPAPAQQFGFNSQGVLGAYTASVCNVPH